MNIGVIGHLQKLNKKRKQKFSGVGKVAKKKLTKEQEEMVDELFPRKPTSRKKIIELLDKEELEYKYLDLGVCSEGRYIGFKLNADDAIITSSKNIYRNKTIEIRKGDKITKEKENEIKKLFEYEGYISDIAPTISKETIKRYYTKFQRNHIVNPKDLYKTTRDKILHYMDFSKKDEIADVLTCWIIATYFYDLFYWFPHILFNAPSTSGKSKGAFIVIQLSFRGFDLGASAGVTPPQIFRTLEGNRGTILIDEFEQKDGVLASDSQRLVNQIMNASAARDAYIIRPEQIGKKWISKKFPIYSPKISCNISGINPTSLSRYIAFSWLKSKGEKSKRKPQREKDKKSFEPIRNDLYLLSLEKWEEISDIYENLEINLSDRDEDNWLPLFTIARFIDNSKGENLNVEGQLKKYLENYKELQIETNDNTGEFFQILLEKLDERERFHTPKEIGTWSEISDLFSYLKSPSHKVGKILKDYKFKSTRGGGIKRYLLSKQKVQEIVDLYFNTDIIPQKPTKDTKPHKQHKTTQTTPEEEKNRENVVLGGISVIIPEGGVEDKTPKKPINPEKDWSESDKERQLRAGGEL
jgi:hypothetical protein